MYFAKLTRFILGRAKREQGVVQGAGIGNRVIFRKERQRQRRRAAIMIRVGALITHRAFSGG